MTTITKEQVIDSLREIAVEMPNVLNPTMSDPEGGTVCSYSQDGKRCIAGESIFRLTGKNLPSDLSKSVYSVLHGTGYIRFDLPAFDDEAINVLSEAQLLADNQDDGMAHPQPWGEIIPKVLDIYAPKG